MAQNTKIEWTDETWNPTSGCTRVSAGCDNCYAVPMTHRLETMGQAKYGGLTVLNSKGDRQFNGTVRTHESELGKPFKWRKPRLVFVNSMSDLFHKDVPFDFIDKVMAVIALTPQHTYQVLTKRPERMAEYFKELYAGKREVCGWIAHKSGWESAGFLSLCFATILKDGVIPNLWLGTSIENQQTADERIPHLLQVPAAVRFLSAEPLLERVKLWPGIQDIQRAHNLGYIDACRWREENPVGIHWVIAGGESGHNARVSPVDALFWVGVQCKIAGIPYFIKQLGSVPQWRSCEFGSLVDCDNWPCGHKIENRVATLLMKHPKGGDPSEWPEALRVRQWPRLN